MHVLIFFVALLFCNCSNSDLKNNSVKGQVIEVTKETFEEELNSFGTISYKTKNYVSTQVSGILENCNVHDGDKISKGQIIGNLSNVQLNISRDQCLSNLEQAKSNLIQCQNDYNNAKLSCEKHFISLEKEKLKIEQKEKELEYLKQQLENNKKIHKLGGMANQSLKQAELDFESFKVELEIEKKEFDIMKIGYREIDLIENKIKPITDNYQAFKDQIIQLNTKNQLEQVNQSKSNLEIAKNELKSVNKLIKELVIKSPVEGIAAAKSFENGEFVKENDTIITILDTSEVVSFCSVQEKDIYKINLGQKCNIQIVSSEKNFESTISEINPIADSSTGCFTFKTSIPNVDQSIKPGMFVKCKINLGTSEELFKIPQDALVGRNMDFGKIYTVQDKKAFIREVNILKEENGFYWIKVQSTSPTLKIINKPSPFIMEGTYVEEI